MSCSLPTPRAGRCRSDRVAGHPATIADLAWLRARDLDRALLVHVAAGKPLLGICGGFQMLGRVIRDPYGIEGPGGQVTEVEGLGLLDVETAFSPQGAAATARRRTRCARVGVRDSPRPDHPR